MAQNWHNCMTLACTIFASDCFQRSGRLAERSNAPDLKPVKEKKQPDYQWSTFLSPPEWHNERHKFGTATQQQKEVAV